MDKTRQPRIYKFAIMVLPVGVVIGTAVFMWMYYAKHQAKQNEQSVISAPGIRAEDLKDMVQKLTKLIGARNVETESGRRGLRQATLMIESRLGPKNTGFQVKHGKGEAIEGKLWKSLWVDVRGQEVPEQVIIAAVSYAGSEDEADAYCVSTLIMVASSMAKEKPASTVRFVFLPFDHEPVKQDKWLLDRCVQEGESCIGIIGIRAINKKAHDLSAPDWLPHDTEENPWWRFLKGEAEQPAAVGQSVWLEHHAFYRNSYVDFREKRIEATLKAAKEVREWLSRAANMLPQSG